MDFWGSPLVICFRIDEFFSMCFTQVEVLVNNLPQFELPDGNRCLDILKLKVCNFRPFPTERSYFQTSVRPCPHFPAFMYRLSIAHVQTFVRLKKFPAHVILNSRRPSRELIFGLDILDFVWDLCLSLDERNTSYRTGANQHEKEPKLDQWGKSVFKASLNQILREMKFTWSKKS